MISLGHERIDPLFTNEEQKVVVRRHAHPPHTQALFVNDVTDLVKMAALKVAFSRLSNVDL